MDRYPRQKINNETMGIRDTLDKMDLIDVFRAFYPKATNYTFCPSAHGTFSRTDHMSNLNKLKIEITSTVFSNHHGIKLEINCKKEKKRNRKICKHMEAK